MCMSFSSLRPHRLARAALPLLALALPLLLPAGCQSLSLLPRSRPADKPDSGSSAATPAPLPRKHEVPVAPYLFLSDFEVPPDQPLFPELAHPRDPAI